MGWEHFCNDYQSNPKEFTDDLRKICKAYTDEKVDLRPYYQFEPITCTTVDRLPKVLEIFRHFHCRALPVLDPRSGLPVAVLTRQDLIAYMTM